MNKKIKLLIALTLSSILGITTFVCANNELLNIRFSAEDKPATMSCNYYFNNPTYLSLYELNYRKLNNGDVNNKTTWGTVTCNYRSGSRYYSIIQSTDQYGNVSSTALYDIGENNQHPVGSVVTVTGTMVLYNGMSQMSNCTITKDYDENPYKVQSFEIDRLPDNDESDFYEYRYMGTRKVTISGVTLGTPVSSRQSTATLPNGETMLLFYNSLSNQTAINERVDALSTSGATVDVTGYLSYYEKGNNHVFEIALRDPDDLKEVSEPVEVETITATTNKEFAYNSEVKISDFTVTGYFDDDSHKEVSGATLVDVVDTTEIGYVTANISYTYNDKTVYTSCEIYVENTISSISVYDPVVHYTYDEQFIMPTVYGYDYYGEHDITDEANHGEFISYYDHDGTMEIYITNSMGQLVMTTYEYYVSDVINLYPENNQTTFELNEPYDNPTFIANFAKDSSLDVDVSNRVTIDGFDSSTVGEKIITYSLGNCSNTYTINVVNSQQLTYIEVINPVTEYIVGDDFNYPEVIAYYSNGTSKDVSDEATFSGYNLLSAGVYEVVVTYESESTTYDITVTQSSLSHICLDSSYSMGIGGYNTGNYGYKNIYEYYRAVNSSNNLMKLIPLQETFNSVLGGALYNTSAIKDIDSIAIRYKTNYSSGTNTPKIYYGENNYDDGYVSLDYSTSYKSVEFNLSSVDINYFKIDCGDTELTINSVDIYYSDSSTSHGSTFNYKDANSGQVRLTPTTFSGELKNGKSYVDVPTNLSGTTTKRYTYYSYDYISEHPELKSLAAMTDAVDVCNYFQAFKCAPANYGVKSGSIVLDDDKYLPSISDVSNLFGDDARVIQEFSRTNGYAQSVPYYGYKPRYFEFDIDTNGLYSVNNRQVGRIVAWYTGFTGSDYGNGSQVVCDYTDDHYATFAEYNNYGAFLPRFNAERKISGSIWSNPVTYSL